MRNINLGLFLVLIITVFVAFKPQRESVVTRVEIVDTKKTRPVAGTGGGKITETDLRPLKAKIESMASNSFDLVLIENYGESSLLVFQKRL